jgi:hypothetical protein
MNNISANRKRGLKNLNNTATDFIRDDVKKAQNQEVGKAFLEHISPGNPAIRIDCTARKSRYNSMDQQTVNKPN